MSRKHFFSIIFFICSYLLTFIALSAQEEQGEIIIISERVGKEIDQEENDKFKIFEGVKGFQSAVYIKLPDGRYFLKITYLDEKTGEIKISRIQQSDVSIKIRGDYIDRFEEIQARREEEERGGEIIIISGRVGEEIDREKRDNYKLFQEVKGFQSAVLIKLPDNRFILKIIYQDDQTGELEIDRIQQSKESINNIRYSIDHFGEKQADQDTVYQEPGAAFFLEIGGKPFSSINMDLRINKSSRISLGIVDYTIFTQTSDYSLWVDESKLEDGIQKEVNSYMPNIMYYYLRGEKNHKLEIGGGLSVRPVWHKYVNGDFPLAFHGVIGYRYQKKKGFLFRAGFTPSYWPDAGFIPGIGLSFGCSL